MKAFEAINPNGVILYVGQTVSEASRLLIEKGISAAPVLNSFDQCLGMVSKDMLLEAFLNGLPADTYVQQIMQTEFSKLTYNDEVVFSNYKSNDAILVEKDNHLLGVIDYTYLFKTSALQYDFGRAEFKAATDAFFTPIMAVDNYGRIKIINKWMARILDVDDENVLYSLATEIIDNQEILSLLKEANHTEKGITIKGNNYISFCKDILVNHECIGRLLLLRDMSEIEQLVHESEYTKRLNRKLEAIIESSFDGLYLTDGQANTLRLNQGFERIMGITKEQCLGRNMADLVREGVFSRSGTLVALGTGKRATLSLTASTGKEAVVTSNPIYDEDGNIIMVITNVRDITELNMLQRELERVESLQELYKTELEQMKLENSRSLMMTSVKMKELVRMVIRIAAVDSTVLIQGESGTGKELIAEIIHKYSNCSDKPFIKVNCGAIPENLLESELFGYESGAFTGASKSGKAGMFELARGGMIFLDEIGELPLKLQVKLLRVLQDRTIMRVGGIKPIKIECRVIAGTNRDLNTMIDNNQFRLDLFYRLSVIPVIVPPLRDRAEDIPVLMNYFLNIFNQKYAMEKRIDTGVYNMMADYKWPGNVRELENLMERLVVTCLNDIITINDLPADIRSYTNHPMDPRKLMPLKQALENTERELLKKAFAAYCSSYQIAQVLGVNQSTIVRKAKKYGIKH